VQLELRDPQGLQAPVQQGQQVPQGQVDLQGRADHLVQRVLQVQPVLLVLQDQRELLVLLVRLEHNTHGKANG
jgi:hypothetical protein